jgi:uncharacterized protein YbaP (TraB family)
MRRNRRSPLLLPLRGLSLLALALVLWSGLAAASDLHPIRHAEGRLWRIERGGAPPSHIIGTIHVTDPRVRDLPDPIREAFESSQQAAFEMRMTPEERAAMMARLGTSEKSRPLSKLVDRETHQKLVTLAARYGVPEKAVDELHPFALSYLFSFSPEEHQRQAAGDLIFDAWLIQWAYDLGMRVEGLETLEEHLGFIDAVPLRDHATMLRELVEQLETQPDRFERLVENYLDGDMTPVFEELEAEMEKEPGARAFKEALLDQRNHQMVDRMIPLLERGRAFVAVGAAHLPGDEGMLHLLEQRGYRITRVY